MLSVDGSSGSASTNQTATFGYTPSDTAEEALAVPARGSSIHGNPEGLGTPTPKDHGNLASSRRPRSPVTSGAVREVSSSSRHSASSPRRKTSVIRRTKSSPETGQHESVRVGSRLIRRKGASANVDAADDSDMRDENVSRSAGLVSPPVLRSKEMGSGLNLEQALSLLQAEREAYIELQHQAFADAAFLRSHLETEEQQCRGSEERIMQLDRWRAFSELQAQHINNKYQQDVTERDVIITELKDKAKTLSQQNINAEVEIEGLRERYRQEVDAVVRLRSTVSNTEAVRMELAERLSANARLDANREQYMHRFVDEVRQSVDEFRNSERETESIQQRLFFEKTQELMVVEQKIAEQVALISRAEHNINDERAMLYRSQHESDSHMRREVEEMCQERGKLRLELSSASKDSVIMRGEIDEMKQENNKLRIEFLHVSKDAGALNRKLLDKDDELRQLKLALQEANSAPSMSSWQRVNSPDDTEKPLLKGAVEAWQNTCEDMESKNATLRRQLDDQESFVEQLGSELSKQEKRMKEILKKENKSSSSSTQPTSKWGDSVQDLLKGGGAFHTNSTMNSALASTGAPLFDTITNTQYQGNVGILQLASFGRTSGGGDGAKNTGGTGNGDGKDNKGKG